MNDETYEKLKDMELTQGVPMVVKPKDTIEDRIALMEKTISKQQELIDLCLTAVERFGSNSRASYQQFLDEFNRIKDDA
tara:strand:- start:215 stop:451 length:237 start_codon:yes stop_codon:yes gene_type:complete